MYYIRALERWRDELQEADSEHEAKYIAETESLSEVAVGIWEGENWDNAELVAVCWDEECFWK